MAIQIIPDSGSFFFYVRSNNDAGEQVYKKVEIIGWAVDDKTLKPQPVVFPALQVGEVLVFKPNSSQYVEVE